MGWLVGGWLKFLLILRLSQPSLAGVGAGAELGKNQPNANYVPGLFIPIEILSELNHKRIYV